MLRRFWNRLLVRIRKRSAEWRTFAFVACIIVVFTTTYAMILPAITLSTDSAEEAAGFYIEEPVEEAEEWIEETYESDDEGEVNEEEQQEEETDAEISALPDDQAVPDQASEEDGLVVIPETENEDEEIVPDESSESAAENAPEVTEQFLTAEEMVEDGRYIIVRYGDDGNAYAMNQDGIAVPVVYDVENNTAYTEDKNQKIVWTKEGYTLRSDDNTYIKLDEDTENTPAVSDTEAVLSAEKPDEGQFACALYRTVVTDDIPMYYALVLSPDGAFFTTTIIDTKPVKRTILAKEAEETAAGDEEPADAVNEDEEPADAVNEDEEPAVAVYEDEVSNDTESAVNSAPEPIMESEAVSSAESLTEPVMESEASSSAESVAEPVLMTYESGAVIVPVDGADYTIRVSWEADACIPGDAVFKAISLDQQKAYEDYADKAVQAADAERSEAGPEKSSAAIGVFDLTIYDADGTVIQPAAPVSVSVDFGDALDSAADVCAVHFPGSGEQAETEDDGIEYDEFDVGEAAQEVTVIDAVNEDGAVSFEADSFSIYVIVGITLEKTVLASDGHNYRIVVTYGVETGIPEDAVLEASEILNTPSYYQYEVKAETALGMEPRTSDYVRLFDIKIADKDDPELKYQPAGGTTVSVRIELADAAGGNQLSVVHFADSEESGDIVDCDDAAAGSVSFEAEGFSVYAVVGDGITEDEARAAVNFYGKDKTTPIATVYVKNSDTPEELVDIVFDPGCGELDNTKKELFDGWVISTTNTSDGSSYTIATEGKTIEEIRTHLDSMEIKEGDVVNIYAKIVRAITISYEGENENSILGTVNLKILGSNDPNSSDNIAEYTVNMNYTPETSTQAFMGWNVAEGATNIISAVYDGETVQAPFLNGTKLTVKGDVRLSVNAPTGHWLVFDENGKGATYNAPKFFKDGDRTTEPALEMTRLGYSFGGWYRLKDGVSIESVEKDSEGSYIISDDKFEPFVFNQELEDNTTIYAKWTSAQKANYTVIVWKERMSDTYAENGGTGEGKEKNYDFAESYTFEGDVGTIINAVSRGSSSVVDGDTNSTRYYDARIRGIDSGGIAVDKTIAYTGYHCANYTTDVEIKPEGTSVVNVYYDRNTVTYTFYTYGESSGQWRLCTEEGNVYNGRIAVLRPGGDPNNSDDYSEFNGTPRYGDGRTYYYSTTGRCNGDTSVVRELHWEWKSNSGSQWNEYQKSTGLYGEKLNWPEDTEIWWYESHNNTTGTGTRMTYKDSFLPNGSDMTVEYWGTTASASGTIHFWTQDVNGTTYTDQVQVNTGNANFSINDKFTGFTAYQYRTDNGEWHNVGAYNPETGIYGSPVSYGNRLDIRYNRIKESITFMDGSYFDGNGNPVDETPQAEAFRTTDPYYYEADVSSYNEGNSDYYTPPEKAGYTFAGWYADDSCTIKYDFNTMPASGITVYAKWIQNQYRVFLHPNVPETDTTLSWGSSDQDMNFRVSAGSKVSAPTGTRAGYKFIGWYLDEACTEVFDADRFILNDTSVTTPYNKETDLTDPMNKYGNIEGSGYNSDLTGYNGGDRFWITRKLDLYAKWRAELLGAEGIGVRYDPNGGSGAPSDTTLYLDNTDTVAQGASTPPDDTQQFLYWVLQTWDAEHVNEDGTTGAFVDIEGDHNKIYPGETFTVLKSNALIEVLEGSTEQDPKYRYIVQLRAQYGPKDEPTPTHLTWYANGGIASDNVTDRYTDPELQINEAVDIRPADTFRKEGYEFLGWARIDSSGEGYEIAPKELTADDLFLKYENGHFYAKGEDGAGEWAEVTKVAADEKDPYHDLYAVWQKKTYTVSVTKFVTGIDGDDILPFTFESAGLQEPAGFCLVGNKNGADIREEDETVHIEHTKVFENIPYGTEISVTEQPDSNFSVSEYYSITDADNTADNVNHVSSSNGDAVTVKGNVQIVFTNTRKTKLVRIRKTGPDNTTPLGNAEFETTADGTTYTFTSDSEDGFLKNETYPDGILMIPYGEYTITETNPPEGYMQLESDINLVVSENGVRAAPFEVIEPTGDIKYYTVLIPNNPGVVLPNTGGMGSGVYHMGGLLLVLSAGFMLIRKRRRGSDYGV